MVSWIYMDILQIHQDIYVKYLELFVHQSFLNKVIFKILMSLFLFLF